ncbi:MAG: uracil-DNA glycosylase [Rariglobus sp.]|jgi:uracil-DNA glycosylase|nr:uracil-DNA glycosylase [Rariglobus sp.]
MTPAPLTLPPAWSGLFAHGYTPAQFAALSTLIDEAYAQGEVFPAREHIFRALELVRPADVKVVILGQDPYPTPGNAHGLSFSVMPPARTPASLKNIFQSLARCVPGWCPPSSGNLEPWARQGVLLLNLILTVRSGEPMSHARLGWQAFTQAVLRFVQMESPYIVFMLWGGKAVASAQPHIDASKHAILIDQHPSPLAQNRLPPEQKFAANHHFAEANRLLTEHARPPIDWRL